MTEAILIDDRANAKGFYDFLTGHAAALPQIRVLEKEDAMADPGFCAQVRFLFSCWNMPLLSDDDLARLFPRLEAVFYAAGDPSYFAGPFTRRSIPIFTAKDENAIPVAEFVLAQILLANKGYFLAEREYRRGFWKFAFRSARRLSQSMAGNYRSTVGIVGFGAIGSLVAKLLQPFDMHVLVHDPFVSDEDIKQAGARAVGLQELFAVCDVITNHLPDTERTSTLLTYPLFSSMKPHATFINTGRGRQVDEKALVRAMREEPSRLALLDVTRHEPPRPMSAIFRTNNILISPHIAGSQAAEIERLYEAVYNAYLTFRPPPTTNVSVPGEQV
ncbi:NAD(P)-dependent oxidoreductase [Erythrobacter sp.]|uniref:NAD(P)-dependent oxidoreductase n=1 Tax=Erythrobacter sp. TaxID=1042 RepID=UPI001B179F69|nr:NAD(P)-dependent oxidoreductase [Erythrobacter sp.]MBO6526347.1 hypothetical protein [Erythrobacter sp.]MBO6530600.1 hypothetical protein [Erythrobacter sp.]